MDKRLALELIPGPAFLVGHAIGGIFAGAGLAAVATGVAIVVRWRWDRSLPLMAISIFALTLVLLSIGLVLDDTTWVKISNTIGSLVFAVIIGLGVLLHELHLFRTVGLSLLASAGVIGLVLGFAAREVLGNILASLQIALNRSARIGDQVIFDDRWCTVERIHFTYVQLRIWTGNRYVVPVAHFVSEPFENLTMVEPEMMRVVVLKRVVGSKSVGIDGQRLLLVILEEESHGRFLGGFRRHNVPLSGPSIHEREHRWLVLVVRSTSARGQATRARLAVALATLLPRRNVHLVDFDRSFELRRYCRQLAFAERHPRGRRLGERHSSECIEGVGRESEDDRKLVFFIKVVVVRLPLALFSDKHEEHSGRKWVEAASIREVCYAW